MKRAIVSVSDKTGLIDFVKGLVEQGFEIITTGGVNSGTGKALSEAGIKITPVDTVTGFPEILGGRVKTLHPMVHGGLLGVLDNPEHVAQMKEHGIEPISLVCVNLYPFKETISTPGFTQAQAIENIDIGGPSMIRSAAKNHKFVTVVTDPKDYEAVLANLKENQGETTFEFRQKLAAKAFRTTASYDALIQKYLTEVSQETEPERVIYSYELKQPLRYGENPHQKAAFYTDGFAYRYALTNATQLHGKELSYNNIQDANATLQILKDFEGKPCVVAVKHMNPCGVAIAEDITTAWKRAYAADSVSIFGGIVAFNEEVNEVCATEMSQMFLEIILAPSFSKEALEILSKKKNIRLMTFQKEGADPVEKMVSVVGGLLVQNEDTQKESKEECKVVTQAQPSQKEWDDAFFGMKIVKHVKSNAIVLVKDGATCGIGAGQMNRVGAAKIALEQAGDKAKGCVLASDAFFPMNDTVEVAAQYGVSCVIQPGGSIHDQDSIDMCDEKGMSMIFSGHRHFKH